MISYSPTTIYASVWNKYRPVILKLMIAAAQGPQEYKFSAHEFRRLNPREKSGYAFTLHLFQGKATNNIKTSTLAKDLLLVLQQSRTALELTETSTYEIALNKHFVLHVTRLENEQEIPLENKMADQIVS